MKRRLSLLIKRQQLAQNHRMILKHAYAVQQNEKAITGMHVPGYNKEQNAKYRAAIKEAAKNITKEELRQSCLNVH